MSYEDRITQLRDNAKSRAYDAIHDMSLYESLLGPYMQRMDDDTLRRMPTPDCVCFNAEPYQWSDTPELPYVQFEVYAPVDESIGWRERMRPMAAFFNVFGIKTRTRRVNTYNGAVSYTGEVVHNGWLYRVTYNCGTGGLQPSCKLVATETTEVVKITRYQTVCE